uniref:Uncharacterized protein LOC102803589 n=1 Tax=Saccoglossus kowalevskii TaxID=10224 RepID=A0ABM0MTG1_SACKO|nr:PREDICTED: uncharacterized protein LOC102803589 [Saccoglossus kowalevskii]
MFNNFPVEKKGGARPKTPKSAAAQKGRTESQLKDTVKGANKKRAFGKNISDVQSRSITPEDDQLVTFTMKHGPRREMVQCHTSDSLIEAIINHQKQIKGGDQDFNFIFVEIIEGKELKPTIPNLGIPAKLISDKTIVCEVKSPGGSKQQLNPSSLIRKYGRGKNLYTLYISSETVGPTNKSFLVYPNHYSNCRIRIDFTENESLLDALTMDGRFTANLSNFVLVDESYGTEIYLFHKAFSYKDKTLSLKHLGKHVAVTNSR